MPTTEVQDARMARLPAWARDRINLLERELAYERAKLTVGEADSDTIADRWSDAPRPLGLGTRIAFVVSRRENGTPRDFLECYIEDGALTVLGSDSRITVHPRASNSIDVRVVGP